MNTIELWPSPVFGPTRRKRFGKPATVRAEVRLGAVAPLLAQVPPVAPAHLERRDLLGRLEPRGEHDGVDARSVPSFDTIECAADLGDPAVTSSTFSRCSAGR